MLKKLATVVAAALFAASTAFCKEPCPPCPQVGQTKSVISSELGYGSSGSCALIGKDLVLTCTHVLRGLTLVKIDGEVYQTNLVAMDMLNDWALLRLDRDCPLDPLSVVAGKPKEGEKMWGFGHGPFADGKWGVNRCVWKKGKLYGRFYPGDSGGPLCNSSGRVMGVCTSYMPDNGTCQGHGIGELKQFVEKYRNHDGQGVVVQR
jgi:S1-C subfamily serine protease